MIYTLLNSGVGTMDIHQIAAAASMVLCFGVGWICGK